MQSIEKIRAKLNRKVFSWFFLLHFLLFLWDARTHSRLCTVTNIFGGRTNCFFTQIIEKRAKVHLTIKILFIQQQQQKHVLPFPSIYSDNCSNQTSCSSKNSSFNDSYSRKYYSRSQVPMNITQYVNCRC